MAERIGIDPGEHGIAAALVCCSAYSTVQNAGLLKPPPDVVQDMSGVSGVCPAVPMSLSPGPSVSSKSTTTPSTPSLSGRVTRASTTWSSPVRCGPPPGRISRISGPPPPPPGGAARPGVGTPSATASTIAAPPSPARHLLPGRGASPAGAVEHPCRLITACCRPARRGHEGNSRRVAPRLRPSLGPWAAHPHRSWPRGCRGRGRVWSSNARAWRCSAANYDGWPPTRQGDHAGAVQRL
jgi:hypothetical protein